MPIHLDLLKIRQRNLLGHVPGYGVGKVGAVAALPQHGEAAQILDQQEEPHPQHQQVFSLQPPDVPDKFVQHGGSLTLMIFYGLGQY